MAVQEPEAELILGGGRFGSVRSKSGVQCVRGLGELLCNRRIASVS